MMDRKTLLALAIIVTTLIAFGLTVWTVYGRLLIIRATIGTRLPAWVQLLLWGWL